VRQDTNVQYCRHPMVIISVWRSLLCHRTDEVLEMRVFVSFVIFWYVTSNSPSRRSVTRRLSTSANVMIPVAKVYCIVDRELDRSIAILADPHARSRRFVHQRKQLLLHDAIHFTTRGVIFELFKRRLKLPPENSSQYKFGQNKLKQTKRA
jgi:hypothetical protein